MGTANHPISRFNHQRAASSPLFARAPADIVVLETGLGAGGSDATQCDPAGPR